MPYDDAARDALMELESWLWTGDAGVRLAGSTVPLVAEWVCELSDLYTIERGVLRQRQRDREHLAAKALYFLPSDAPKMTHVLRECMHRDAAFQRVTTIVDLGCGVGATSVGALLALASSTKVDGEVRRPLTIYAVDHEPSVLEVYTRIVKQAAVILGVPLTLHTFADNALTFSLPKETELVLSQTALNEHLPGNQAGELVYPDAVIDAVERWARHAPTVLIEPALRVTTRALQRCRDTLLARGGVRVVAPCPHQQSCPMLANERDWCHESPRLTPTPRADSVQRLTRRRDDRALYSFLALVPRGSEAPTVSSGGVWRLVSDPLGSRGKTERWACCDDGRLRQFRVLDKERSETNDVLVTAERGTLVRLPVLPASDRIAPTQVVERV